MNVHADDIAKIIAELPKGARGRKHLESLCKRKRLEQLRDEVANDDTNAVLEALARELEAALDDELSRNPRFAVDAGLLG